MTMSSLLMLEDSNTGCSSIRSVRSALEGTLSCFVWIGGREKARDTSEDVEGDLVTEEPLLELELILLIFVSCLSLVWNSLVWWTWASLQVAGWQIMESSGDTERDLCIVLLNFGGKACVDVWSFLVGDCLVWLPLPTAGLEISESSGETERDLGLVTT